MEWFLCNGNTGLKWQNAWMVKVNVNLQIFLIASSSIRNMKLQLGRWVHTAFQRGRIKSCCYLARKKKLIYNELIWHFIDDWWFRDDIGDDIDDDKNIQKLLQTRLFYVLFTILQKIVFKDFAYFLGKANLRNNSLLVKTILIACPITCQILFVPNLIFIGVVQGRGLEGNSCSESF